VLRFRAPFSRVSSEGYLYIRAIYFIRNYVLSGCRQLKSFLNFGWTASQ
jgi:hypothetical protein